MSSPVPSTTAPVVDDRVAACLIACVRPGADALPLVDAFADLATDDWRRLIAAAPPQGLVPHLWSRIRDRADLPTEVGAELGGLYQAAQLRASRLSGVLLGLLDQLASAGIRAMPLKGPALAADVFGDPGARTFVDLDILVGPADAVRAGDLLAGLGYERVQPRRVVPERELLRAEMELGLCKPGGTLVELHWRVGWRFAAVSIPAEQLFAEARTLELLEHPVLQPSPRDQLILVCGHSAHHGWDRLEMTASTLAAARRITDRDWGEVLDRAAELGCERRILVGLVLAHATAGLPAPVEVRLRAAADPRVRRLVHEVAGAWRHGDPGDGGVVTKLRHISWLARTEDTSIAAAVHLGSRALRPGQEDWDSLPLPPCLFGLYHLWRPLRLAIKFARHARAS